MHHNTSSITDLQYGQTEENYRIRDLADIVAELLPGCRVEYAPDAARQTLLPRQLRQDPPRAAGIPPQWTAHKGAQELYEAYRAAGLSFAILSSVYSYYPIQNSCKRAVGQLTALEHSARRYWR